MPGKEVAPILGPLEREKSGPLHQQHVICRRAIVSLQELTDGLRTTRVDTLRLVSRG